MISENESDIKSKVENSKGNNKNKYAGPLLLFVIACARLGGVSFKVYEYHYCTFILFKFSAKSKLYKFNHSLGFPFAIKV